MAVEPTIGIDLGTTNSVVASCTDGGDPRVLPDEHDEKIHPSVVSFHPNGTVIVGSVAKQRRVIDPANTVYSIKRLIGRPFPAPEVQAAIARVPFPILEGDNQQPVIRTRGGSFAIPELSAIVLDHMRSIAARALRRQVDRAVITVPANFNEGQRAATAAAGAIAGLQVEQIINEPTAAALAYGHRRKLDRLIAVYDFGGGTFDISVLKLEDNVYQVLATSGNSFLGGDDIDETLVDHMVDVFLRQQSVDLRADDLAMQRLRAVAEQIKIQLSRRTRAIVKIDEIAYGPGGRGLDLDLEINREELVARCAHVVDQTFPVCDEALALAQVDRAAITDVVLVGGTTKMPYVRQRATQYFGSEPRVDVNPDEAVALGAAVQADILARQAAGMVFSPRSGTASHSEITERGDKFPTLDSEITDAEALEPPRFAPRDTLRGVSGRSTFRGAPPPPRLPGALPGPDSSDTIDDARPTAAPSARTLFEPPAAAHARLDHPPLSPGDETGEQTVPRTPRPRATSTQAETVPQAPVPALPAPLSPSPIPAEPLAGFGPPPTIREVTPHSLGIGTVGGYCEPLIRRNTALPHRTSRTFSTSRDGQQTVRIMVFQGESRRLGDNLRLGDLVLQNLPPRARGETTIEVTFSINASGMLDVSAVDTQTGAQQSASVELLGAQTRDEVTASQVRLRQLLG